MQITQVWSGAESAGRKKLLKLSMSFEQDRYFLKEPQRDVVDRQPALKTDKIHMQSRIPILWMKALMKSLIRLQQCHTRTELPTICSISSILQVDGISLMFWLKQLKISFCDAMLETSRKIESTANMRVGKSSKLLSFIVIPSKMICTTMKQRTLAEKRTIPNTFEADKMSMILRLQAQSLRIISRSILMI